MDTEPQLSGAESKPNSIDQTIRNANNNSESGRFDTYNNSMLSSVVEMEARLEPLQ